VEEMWDFFDPTKVNLWLNGLRHDLCVGKARGMIALANLSQRTFIANSSPCEGNRNKAIDKGQFRVGREKFLETVWFKRNIQWL
jgi:hypothetical protein